MRSVVLDKIGSIFYLLNFYDDRPFKFSIFHFILTADKCNDFLFPKRKNGLFVDVKMPKPNCHCLRPWA